jgi:hypothetical protein
MEIEIDGQKHSRPLDARLTPSLSARWGCFVATAAFNHEPDPTVDYLRRFRDDQLSRSALGRYVIRVYEEIGPRLADHLERRPLCKPVVRVALRALVAAMRCIG